MTAKQLEQQRSDLRTRRDAYYARANMAIGTSRHQRLVELAERYARQLDAVVEEIDFRRHGYEVA